MRLLMQIRDAKREYLLLSLSDPEACRRIRKLISSGDRARAKDLALSEGNFGGIFPEKEINSIEADMIISDKCSHRDLTRRSAPQSYNV